MIRLGPGVVPGDVLRDVALRDDTRFADLAHSDIVLIDSLDWAGAGGPVFHNGNVGGNRGSAGDLILT